VDDAGDAYITGFCYYIANFDNISITNGNTSYTTNHFVAKYDSDGTAVWARNAASSSIGTDTVGSTVAVQGFGITVDANTNVIVTGHFAGTANFGSGSLVNDNSRTEGGSVFLTKYDRNGNLLWAKKGIGGAAGIGQAVRTDDAGNIYGTS
jgi:hypothetical protein